MKGIPYEKGRLFNACERDARRHARERTRTVQRISKLSTACFTAGGACGGRECILLALQLYGLDTCDRYVREARTKNEAARRARLVRYWRIMGSRNVDYSFEDYPF